MSAARLPRGLVLFGLLFAGACRPPAAPQSPNAPTARTTPQSPRPDALEPVREFPPTSAPAREVSFPSIGHEELPNGLRVDLVSNHALPIVQLRLLIKSGSAADGDLTGVTNLTAQLLKEGGAGRFGSQELLTHVETMGGDLAIDVGPDATTFSLAVTRVHFEEALELLGAVAQKPRFSPTEFAKLRKRLSQRAADKAKTSGPWAATMLLWRELYRMPVALHPYASYDATAGELERLKLTDCQAHYRTHYVPENAVLVMAGDLDTEAAKRAAERAFGEWRGGTAPKPKFGEATPPDHVRILLADRPKSTQTDLYVAALGPERHDDGWVHAKVANQILGGGVGGRLFLDIREKRSLAYNTRSSLGELAHGPVPFAAYTGTQTAKTGLALEAMIENLKRLAAEPPSEDELATARRYLADAFAIKMETVGAIADMVVALETFGLPDDHYDVYRKRVEGVSAGATLAVAREAFRPEHWVIAAAGDADRIGPLLSHFGDVLVFNPEKEFEKLRTIPANPSAPLELDHGATQ